VLKDVTSASNVRYSSFLAGALEMIPMMFPFAEIDSTRMCRGMNAACEARRVMAACSEDPSALA
jgi:hypothetical protein